MSSMTHNKTTSTACDPRWQQVLARDQAADNAFVYAVRTTGVYCRPSSPTRLPDPKNVEFFATAALAEAAGYRPSMRGADKTSMAQQHRQIIAIACRAIASSDSHLPLASLAETAGLSTFHFHRVFKSITGLTPKGYANAHRANKVRLALDSKQTVTQAIYDSGFNSNSSFYETANQMLGMTPTHYRDGGVDTTMHFAIGASSLGAILVAQSHIGVCAILLGNDPQQLIQELQDKFKHANLIGGDARFEHLIAQVVGMIEAPGIGINLPLDVRGTAFQQRVWHALRQIPAGTTASYAEIAQAIGAPTSARAVAQACGANVLAVAIPCHRVVRNDGNLSGYRWGIERKRRLLEREMQPQIIEDK